MSLPQVSESLAEPQTNEKNAILGMFERETKREKNLEQRAKEVREPLTCDIMYLFNGFFIELLDADRAKFCLKSILTPPQHCTAARVCRC